MNNDNFVFDYYKEVSNKTDVDLLVEMLIAQNIYSSHKVHKKEYDVFEKTMTDIIYAIRQSKNITDASLNLRELSNNTLIRGTFFKRMVKNDYPIKELAFTIAEDAIQSVRSRFVDGASKIYDGILQSKFTYKRS